jgi:organic radical activating enzyme
MDLKNSKIKLLELFTSFQGEGTNTGKLCTFIRFKKCNKNCSFCDTMLKMKYDPEAEYSYDSILELGERTNYNFVITGGEPTLPIYRQDIINLLNFLINQNGKLGIVEIETNGYQMLDLVKEIYDNNIHEKCDLTVNISPKYTDDYDDELNYIVSQIKQVQKFYDMKYIFKIVAFDYQNNFDLTKHVIESLIKIYNIPSPNIYLMPEGISRESLTIDNRKLMEICFKYRINFSSRLHVLHNFS